MLEQRQQGQEPDFDQFMERFGDFFPENPENLDQLLEIMAERMAAMQAMLNSMTPEQRAQLQGLAEQLMEDMDLRWQMDQLGQNLQNLFPQMGWNRSYDFSGQDPLGFAEAAQMMQELGDIDQLENLLRGATTPGALAEVDLDRARQLLGDESAQSLDRMSELARMLEEAGLIENKEGRFELTPRGIRRIGQNALKELFAKLTNDQVGRHELERSGWATSASTTPSPTSSAIPSTSTSSARCATPCAAAAGAPPCSSPPRTSRWSGPSTWCGPRRCSCSTCRCRCPCATTSCRPRRSPWPCTR